MIVYDLRCADDHRFEGWFADSQAFATQRSGGLVSCPYCGGTRIERLVSPLRIGTSDAGGSSADMNVVTPDAEERTDRLRTLAAMQSEMLKTSRWVGKGFAEHARAMAEGTEPTGTIHGQATLAEAKALHDDGVAVMPLPFAPVPPEQLN